MRGDNKGEFVVEKVCIVTPATPTPDSFREKLNAWM